MRFGKKMALRAICAGPAVAAMIVVGAGAASAFTFPGPSGPFFPPHGPGHSQPTCNPRALERWDVSGGNTVDLTFNNSPFSYAVSLSEHGSCVTGTLTDIGLTSPNLQVTGTINNDHLKFSVTYPTGYQGKRTFTGTINWHGNVSGTWNESGTENGSGTWTLAQHVRAACHGPSWQHPRGCQVPAPHHHW